MLHVRRRCLRPAAAALSVSALLTCLAQSQTRDENEGARLVEESRCYTCHQLRESLLGPPYLAIAARHAARKDIMTEVLARKIVYGGGGSWGLVPMVPNQWVTLDDARVMSAWILDLTD